MLCREVAFIFRAEFQAVAVIAQIAHLFDNVTLCEQLVAFQRTQAVHYQLHHLHVRAYGNRLYLGVALSIYQCPFAISHARYEISELCTFCEGNETPGHILDILAQDLPASLAIFRKIIGFIGSSCLQLLSTVGEILVVFRECLKQFDVAVLVPNASSAVVGIRQVSHQLGEDGRERGYSPFLGIRILYRE